MDRTAQIETLFFEALEIDDSSRRDAYLTYACAGDDALHTEVARLLRAHSNAGVFLTRPAIEQFATDLQATYQDDAADTIDDDFLISNAFSPSSRSDSLGRLGRYEVMELRGRGSCGIVFRAIDTVLQRTVAIKVLSPPLGTTRSARRRFLAEARATARLRHPNIVHVYAVEEEPSLCYLVMEYSPGESLQQRLSRQGRLDIAEVIRIGQQIAEGLAALHVVGLIHRDIKPENILLEVKSDGTACESVAKISDFGLARCTDDVGLTQYGIVAGTPMFMAPEQATGDTLDHRTDLFSLGSVLYTMCCGQAPFRGPSTFAILSQVVESLPVPVCQLAPQTPRWLCEIIARLHAKHPSERFASAREVADLMAHQMSHLHSPPASYRRPIANIAAVLSIAAVGIVAATGVSDLRGMMLPSLDPRKVSVSDADDGRHLKLAIDHSQLRIAVIDGTGDGAGWEAALLRMSADQQVEAVIHQLKLLNPDYDGTHQSGDSVFELMIRSDSLENIAPVRAISQLKTLFINGKRVHDLTPLRGLRLVRFGLCHSAVRDLSPLQDMPLDHLDLSGSTEIHDLTPLIGTPIRELSIAFTAVRDLLPLKDLRLTTLNCDTSDVRDLSPLRGMALHTLQLHNTRISDLSPLAQSQLRHLCCDNTPIDDGDLLQLQDCQRLTHLSVKQTDVTPDGVQSLAASLPECEIHWDGGVVEPQ